jgi:hypothetical protein
VSEPTTALAAALRSVAIGCVTCDDWAENIITALAASGYSLVPTEARALLLDELEAAVRDQEKHEGSLASRTDINLSVSLDAESRVSAYRHVLFLIQQHREAIR